MALCINGDAKIYKWVDENGQTHFSQNKPAHLKIESANKKKSLNKLKDFLYPFGSSAILKESKKAYCDRSAAISLLRNIIVMKKRELAKYKKYNGLQRDEASNRIYEERRRLEQEISQYRYKLKNKSNKERYLSKMQKKCADLKRNKVIDKQRYDISASGFKRIFKKEDRKYIDFIGIAIYKYISEHDARNRWNRWNRKSSQKKYTRVEKKKLNGMQVLLMDDKADFAVGFILLEDTLIEIQFGSGRFVEFTQFQYFIKRYTRWLATKF